MSLDIHFVSNGCSGSSSVNGNNNNSCCRSCCLILVITSVFVDVSVTQSSFISCVSQFSSFIIITIIILNYFEVEEKRRGSHGRKNCVYGGGENGGEEFGELGRQ